MLFCRFQNQRNLNDWTGSKWPEVWVTWKVSKRPEEDKVWLTQTGSRLSWERLEELLSYRILFIKVASSRSFRWTIHINMIILSPMLSLKAPNRQEECKMLRASGPFIILFVLFICCYFIFTYDCYNEIVRGFSASEKDLERSLREQVPPIHRPWMY